MFLDTYDRLSAIGVCDRPGGVEFYRMLHEWIDAGDPEPEAFIRRRANMQAPGSRIRDQPFIYPGDVVRHTNSGRIGIVLESERAHRDGSVEYLVRTGEAPNGDFNCITRWNSQRVDLVRMRDPYRRYLTLCAREDDPAGQARRRAHPRSRIRRYGGWFSAELWEKMYWRLTNRRRLLPYGGYVHYSLGREHWGRAAVDCLDRRDRSNRHGDLPSCPADR
jgi:hypothetical protein